MYLFWVVELRGVCSATLGRGTRGSWAGGEDASAEVPWAPSRKLGLLAPHRRQRISSRLLLYPSTSSSPTMPPPTPAWCPTAQRRSGRVASAASAPRLLLAAGAALGLLQVALATAVMNSNELAFVDDTTGAVVAGIGVDEGGLVLASAAGTSRVVGSLVADELHLSASSLAPCDAARAGALAAHPDGSGTVTCAHGVWSRLLSEAAAAPSCHVSEQRCELEPLQALRPGAALVPSNRALAQLKRGEFEAAAADTSAALEVLDGQGKSLLRRVDALVGLGRYTDALADVVRARELEPGNRQAAAEARRVRELRRNAVRRAPRVAIGGSVSVVERLV